MSEQHDAQQLTLLPATRVPARFRLDDATRRRGLAHVAELREQMEARRAARYHAESAGGLATGPVVARPYRPAA